MREALSTCGSYIILFVYRHIADLSLYIENFRTRSEKHGDRNNRSCDQYFLNASLIFGLFFFPQMGIAGAALATSVSKLIEMAWAFMESLREKHARLHVKLCFSVEQQLVKDYWRYSLPMLGDYLVWGVGFTMYSVIMGHLGNDAVAANSIANIVKT